MMQRRNFIQGSLAASFMGGVCKELVAADTQSGKFPHRANVAKLENLTHNIKRVRLRPDGAFAFTPGQHVLLNAPTDYVADFNNRYDTSHTEVYRPYSFASSPSDSSLFDLIIKHYPTPPDKNVPPGIVSTYVHKHLNAGDTVALSKPRGSLYTEDGSDRPIVVVAGGVGAAPFVCLLNYWFEHGVDRKIYFFLGVRSKRDLLLNDLFNKWSKSKDNFLYIPALSHPEENDQWTGATGYINVVVDKYFQDSLDADVYLAGPPIMVKFTREVLEKKGVDEDHVHRDPIRVR
jgi:Na+-transporting NADH:ubiquinone oxidoreductase subunit F